jgi:glucosamine kinase
MMAVFRGSPEHLVEFTTTASPGDLGGFAPKVLDHAERGDAVAVSIVGKAVADVEAALAALDLRPGDPLCLLGGLAPLYAPRLSSRFRNLLKEPLDDALGGAVRMAARLFGREANR